VRLNARSNLPELGKTAGCKKLSSAHSSVRLFCSGVPVSRRAEAKCSRRTVWEISELVFLMMWPSSNTRRRHQVLFWGGKGREGWGQLKRESGCMGDLNVLDDVALVEDKQLPPGLVLRGRVERRREVQQKFMGNVPSGGSDDVAVAK
jgi:hypothetical protein